MEYGARACHHNRAASIEVAIYLDTNCADDESVDSPALIRLTPSQQLRAGRLGRRLPQLFGGLILYGVSMGFIVRGALGLDPWDVFHQGLITHLPISFGTVTVIVGIAVLLLWIPLRQLPGLGTIANALVIGPVVDLALWLLPQPQGIGIRVAMLIGGIVLNGLAGGLYIGAQLGPGPRDGLMTGLAARTGCSIRIIRTSIEITVLIVGFALGGGLGIGTLLYALTIGPLVQFFLRHLTVRLSTPPDR